MDLAAAARTFRDWLNTNERRTWWVVGVAVVTTSIFLAFGYWVFAILNSVGGALNALSALQERHRRLTDAAGPTGSRWPRYVGGRR